METDEAQLAMLNKAIPAMEAVNMDQIPAQSYEVMASACLLKTEMMVTMQVMTAVPIFELLKLDLLELVEMRTTLTFALNSVEMVLLS